MRKLSKLSILFLSFIGVAKANNSDWLLIPNEKGEKSQSPFTKKELNALARMGYIQYDPKFNQIIVLNNEIKKDFWLQSDDDLVKSIRAHVGSDIKIKLNSAMEMSNPTQDRD